MTLLNTTSLHSLFSPLHDAYGMNWAPRLERVKLAQFSQLWNIEADWFEAPNIRRGGWSGVVKVPLDQHDNSAPHLFIKRQENHISRTWAHPISGIPTFYKEYANLQLFNQKQIPTQDCVYYGARQYNGTTQAVLVTEELVGFYPLDSILPQDDIGIIKNTRHRMALLSAVAKTIRKMHDHRIQHNSLYPKHLFVKPLDVGWDVRFIDLEKAKRRLLKRTAIERDLSTFRRHTLDWTTREQLHFFKAYVNETKLSKQSKDLWYRIQDRLLKKSK